MPDNIVLIGFSGTGKSSVGRLLADRLDWPFIDTDDLIVERFGKAIGAVFRDQGEAAFRAAERDAVAIACAGARRVISLGGGAPVDPDNRARLGDRNLVVRLDALPETIFDRLTRGRSGEERPMLAGADPLARIRALLEARTEAYAIADLTVDTEGRTTDDVVGTILQWLETAPRHYSIEVI
ncbi:MAG: shikimate kinase [Chloroflexota bacterium]